MADPDSPAIHSPTTKKQSSDLPAQKKTLSSFLYKAIIFAIFVALLPLFPPQIPDSTNPTLLSRTWELLHLLLVGIAVSYGLFSQRNADPELDKDKDAAFKADTPHSYVSRILQISSVFDDDTAATEESKVEAWSSQYHSTEPVVVESKPLLMPVRSLRKSRAHSPDSSEPSVLDSSSVVHPSPIPWRSRSGRMVAGDEDIDMVATSPIPAFYAKAGSFSSELRGKASENSIRTKSFHGAAPPPPPPPPPFSYGSISFERREAKKSFKDELEDLSIKGREGFLKNSCVDAEQLEPEISPSPRSVRNVRSKEAQSAEKYKVLMQPKYQTETKKEKEKKKKVEFMGKIMPDDSESDNGSDSYDDEEEESAEVRAEAKENEVDKKADEFIAKFREQIRLQRIESIKKSSRHRPVANS